MNPADFKIINADKISQIECRTSLSAQQLTQIIVDTDKFIDDLISELRLSGDNIFLAQLWFHYAIVNKQKRKILSGECNCTVDPSYLVGKTNFLCMEDHYINRTTTINTINQNPLAFTDNKWRQLLTYLQNSQQEQVSFKDAYNFFIPISEYNEVIRRKICILGQGSSWGCCGNYSGWCLVHDAMCSNCKPRWFCFSGCVPD